MVAVLKGSSVVDHDFFRALSFASQVLLILIVVTTTRYFSCKMGWYMVTAGATIMEGIASGLNDIIVSFIVCP